MSKKPKPKPATCRAYVAKRNGRIVADVTAYRARQLWDRLIRADMGDSRADLRSRGWSVVPILMTEIPTKTKRKG